MLSESIRRRWSQIIGTVVFYALLTVLFLTAIPYGAVEPWWRAVFQCAIFTLSLLWVVDATFSGKWLVGQHRLLIPLVALVVFALIQTVLPLRSGSPSHGAGLHPISFAPYDTKMVALPNQGASSSSGGFGQFINHNHFALLAEMSLGLILGVMLRRPLRLVRLILCLMLAIPMWIGIVYSGSRGGLASMTGEILFVGLLMFIASPKRHLIKEGDGYERVRSVGPPLIARIVLSASFLVVMAVGIVWLGGDPLASRLESAPNELGVKDFDKYARVDRSTIWPTTWQMIKEHPLLGVGFGGYWIAITKYHNGSGEFTPQQAHNDYLELLASGGLVGAALVVWFIALFLTELIRRSRSWDATARAYSGGALAGIFAVAIHSIFDFGLHITINSLLFVSLLTIAIVTLPRVNQPMTRSS